MIRNTRTHWFLLIDKSGSMHNGFSEHSDIGNAPDDGAKREKIHAAKDQAAKWVRAIKSGDSVSIIAFSDEPDVLCTRITEEFAAVEALSAVVPDGRTNIAAAFDCAVDKAHELQLSKHYRYVNIQLISDGLSNVGDPYAAARRAGKLGYHIKTILIDRTDEGIELAEKISPDGFDIVRSEEQIEHAGAAQRAAHERRMAQDRSFLTFLALVTSAVVLISTTSGGIAYKLLDNVFVGASVLLSVAIFFTAIFLPFKFFGREEYMGLYLSESSTDRETKWRFVYSLRKRMFVVFASCLLLLGSVAILLNAAALYQKNKRVGEPTMANGRPNNDDESAKALPIAPFPGGRWIIASVDGTGGIGLPVEFEGTVLKTPFDLLSGCNDPWEYSLVVEDLTSPTRVVMSWGDGEQRSAILKWSLDEATICISTSPNQVFLKTFEGHADAVVVRLVKRRESLPNQ